LSRIQGAASRPHPHGCALRSKGPHLAPTLDESWTNDPTPARALALPTAAAQLDIGPTHEEGEVPDLARPPTVVAIFNTNPEVLDLVREALQDAGYATVVAHIDDLKRGRIDMIQFVEEHKPHVIVYDVAPPYDTNWTFLRLMRNSKVMQNRAFVVTTTNKKALDDLIGPSDVVELLCKPYDLEQIVESVNRALITQVKNAANA
jgi:CheY-like chemotaxis protein